MSPRVSGVALRPRQSSRIRGCFNFRPHEGIKDCVEPLYKQKYQSAPGKSRRMSRDSWFFWCVIPPKVHTCYYMGTSIENQVPNNPRSRPEIR